MENITIEQALQNIEAGLANFVGKKQDHIILEQSFHKVKETLNRAPHTLFDAKVTEVESK